MMTDPARPRLPWSPTGIAIVTLILSPLPGGILHALNYVRLGVPSRRPVALFTNLFSGISLLLLPYFLQPSAGWRLAGNLFLAVYFFKSQDCHFQTHRSAGGTKASLVLPVILTATAFLVVVFAFNLLRRVFG
jgi:hypothetical protein